MKKSFAVSTLFHAALIIGSLLVLPSPKPLIIPEAQAVVVDISQISDKSAQKATTTKDVEKKAKPAPVKKVVEEKIEAPKEAEKVNKAVNEPTPSEPPPPKQEVKKEEKKPEPKKVEEAKKEEPKKEDKPLDADPLKDLLKVQEAEEAEVALLKKKEEEKKIEEQKKKAEAEEKKKLEAEKKKKAEEEKKLADEMKKAEEEQKAAEAKEKAEADKKKKVADAKKKKKEMADIAAFLNKEEGERAAPQESAEDGSPEKAEKAKKGTDPNAAATLISVLTSKIRDCWTVPPAARDSNVTVKVQFQLAEDGSVIGNPVQVGGGRDPIALATASAAISAIKQCENYDLPADQYDMWKDVILDFNPNMMDRT